jgi:hypothetical protein
VDRFYPPRDEIEREEYRTAAALAREGLTLHYVGNSWDHKFAVMDIKADTILAGDDEGLTLEEVNAFIADRNCGGQMTA